MTYDISEQQLKSCNACDLPKPLTDFYRSPNTSDGLCGKCKQCTYYGDLKRVEAAKKLPVSGLKQCCRCKTEKPIAEFNKRLRSADGLRNECKKCGNSAEASYRRTHTSQESFRRIKAKYGLDRAGYDQLLTNQSGLCAICRRPTLAFDVDHDHKTGAVRGLLCHTCNIGLGSFKDNVEYLANAIRYLEKSFQ